jgi:hypothetical protein
LLEITLILLIAVLCYCRPRLINNTTLELLLADQRSSDISLPSIIQERVRRRTRRRGGGRGRGRGRPLEEVDVAVVTTAEKIGDTDRSNKEDESP